MSADYEGWAILELMGHRRLAGKVSEVAGGALAGFLRIDVPGDGDAIYATQFYAPAAVYCLTPTSEETARAVAKTSRPAPVQAWELPALPAPAVAHFEDDPDAALDEEEDEDEAGEAS